MRVGFIGLGTLGKTMVRRLISEGVELTLWNRTGRKCEGLGMKIASSPAELISSVDTLFLNLFDSHAVNTVLGGEKGLLSGDCKGKIIVERAFTPPPGFKPKIILEKQDLREEFQAKPDNHFANILAEFHRAIVEGDHKKHLDEVLDQARILDEIRKKG